MTGHGSDLAVADLAVVGAGPAGRALAHRAVTAGLRVHIVDPEPDRLWTATYGMYADDLPSWLEPSVVAAFAPTFTVFTPGERVVERGYVILASDRLQAALSIDDAIVHEARATDLSATTVTCDDGRLVRARCVVDARGATARDHADRPRQTAAGAVVDSDDPNVVLMDWRAVAPGAPSFSYRVPLGAGRRLVEETCLAGRPPVPVSDLAVRNSTRCGLSSVHEHVDFPMLPCPRPWRRRADEPLRFGAAGGLMNPATGYSVAQSLEAADIIVDAIRDGHDAPRALWTPHARTAFSLRRIGLGVLLGLTAQELAVFFDAFFRLEPEVQRGYLSSRDDAAGIVRAMWALYRRLPVRMKLRVALLALTRN